MKCNHFLLVTVFLTLFAGCKNKQEDTNQTVIVSGKEVYTDTASSSVKVFDKDGRICVQQTSTYYEIVDAYEGNQRIPLLLKITKTDLCFADSVNKDKVYQIEAKSVMDTKSVSWQCQFVATEINLKDNTNTLLAVREGTGSEEDYISRFSLLDGKQIFNCSYGDLRIAIPNIKDKRFIGFVSRNTVGGPIQNMKGENLIGLVDYAGSTSHINTLKIFLKRSAVSSSIPSYTPEMVLVAADANSSVIEDGKSLILMKADEKYTSKDVSGFALKITYYYGDDNESTDIVIPIENDKPLLSKAVYDKEIFDIQ